MVSNGDTGPPGCTAPERRPSINSSATDVIVRLRPSTMHSSKSPKQILTRCQTSGTQLV